MSGNREWFEGKSYGIMGHYLAAPAGNDMKEDMGIQNWNQRVDAFDTRKLTGQLKLAGADYVILSVGQNSGYYCSPNPVYEMLAGVPQGKCSRRDLIAELSDELSLAGIDLLAYLPSGAPDCDQTAVENLEWRWGCESRSGDFSGRRRKDRLVSFQLKWERIIREWSLRWGKKVKGWWIDGCYFADVMYQEESTPNFHSLAAALRSGNPEAVLTFNTGTDTPFLMETEECDYTAGEVSDRLPLPTGREMQNAGGRRLHVMSYLGEAWGQGSPRFPAALAAGYTQYINRRGGVVTWDVPLQYDGTLSGEWVDYLKGMKKLISL